MPRNTESPSSCFPTRRPCSTLAAVSATALEIVNIAISIASALALIVILLPAAPLTCETRLRNRPINREPIPALIERLHRDIAATGVENVSERTRRPQAFGGRTAG